MRTLKKYQKAGQYVWTGQNHTVQKPTGHYNVVATDGKNSDYENNVTYDLSWYKKPLENTRMVTEQPIEPLYGFKDPVFNLAFLGAGLANGAMKGITSIGEKVVTNKPLWTAISANNIKNRIEDEGFVEGVLGHPIETTLDVAMLSPVAKSIYPYVNKGVKNIIPNIKFASNKIASGIDYIARKISPQYDLYRTIETTTPKWNSYPVVDIHGLYPGKKLLYANNPLYDLMVNSKGNDSFFLITPQNVKIGKVNNGAWSGQLIGDTFYDSGNVEGKFVSYGEPWFEFISRGHDGTTALWEFPVAGRRKPNIAATDFKGDKMPYSVEDAYKFISEERALDSEMPKLYKKVKDAGINAELGDIYQLELNLNNKYKNYKRLKDNGTWIKDDIYHANQTVIPNYDWNFNNFLSEPFWKYSFNPESRTLQKELFVPRWGYKQSGGTAIDPNGFWDKRNIENGKVIIPSNRITMKGVNFPVLGVSDTGDMKVMLPNGEYKFNGNNVTEYKMEKGGKTTIGNTSFDVMESFKKLVLSPEYATQVDNSQQVMQNGGEDFKDKMFGTTKRISYRNWIGGKQNIGLGIEGYTTIPKRKDAIYNKEKGIWITKDDDFNRGYEVIPNGYDNNMKPVYIDRTNTKENNNLFHDWINNDALKNGNVIGNLYESWSYQNDGSPITNYKTYRSYDWQTNRNDGTVQYIKGYDDGINKYEEIFDSNPKLRQLGLDYTINGQPAPLLAFAYGGEDDDEKEEKEENKNPWLDAVDKLRLQDLQPLETYQYEGRIRKNEKQLDEQNVWKNNINDYNNQKSILDSYQTAYDKSNKDIGLLLNPEYSKDDNYQNLDNFYNSEEAINNISNQFYGSTIGLNNINIGTLGKNIIDGNVEYPEIQTTKPRTWAKINWQGVDNLGSTFVNLLNNYGNLREARQRENLSPVETQAAAQYDDLTINDLNNVKWGDRYGFNNPFAYDDTTEVQNRGTFVKYGGRCFDEGGQYDNVTPEELDYLIKNGIKFHF